MDLEQLVKEANTGAQLVIDLPTSVVLKLPNVEAPVKSELLGMDPDRFLIMKEPKGDTNIKSKLEKGVTLVVNYMHRGAIYTFQSTILVPRLEPVSLILLSFPQVVSRRELRRDQRVDCFITAKVATGKASFRGAVVDISRSGCRFVCTDRAAFKNLDLAVGDPVQVQLLGVDQGTDTPMKGSLRNKTHDSRAVALGVEFQDLEPDQEESLEGLVQGMDEVARLLY
jgi:c-di-GMP-binding flagellar brake protein YcgR